MNDVVSRFEKIISVCKEDGCDFIDLTFDTADEILALLKEQGSVKWIKCTEQLPSKSGQYLVVKSIMGIFNTIDVCEFALNLQDIDEYDFQDENRHGWYGSDPETGYFEQTNVLYWSKLPKMPIPERSVK